MSSLVCFKVACRRSLERWIKCESVTSHVRYDVVRPYWTIRRRLGFGLVQGCLVGYEKNVCDVIRASLGDGIVRRGLFREYSILENITWAEWLRGMCGELPL
jgi:hypothetical protein